MQARPVIRVADIHAGALADRIEALEDLDGFGAIGVGVEILSRLCHSGVLEAGGEVSPRGL
jgi:hypothetical protein